MVTPPALIAATPVGATTTAFFDVVFIICLRKVVLPDPALPVRNTERSVCLIKSDAILKMGLWSSGVIIVVH